MHAVVMAVVPGRGGVRGKLWVGRLLLGAVERPAAAHVVDQQNDEQKRRAGRHTQKYKDGRSVRACAKDEGEDRQEA